MEGVIRWSEREFTLRAAVVFFWNGVAKPYWTIVHVRFAEVVGGELVDRESGFTRSCMSQVNGCFNSIFCCSHN